MEPEEGMRVRTALVPIKIFTENFEILGNVHIKPGGYFNRVTDILNLGKISFLPVTQARYRLRKGGPEQYADTDCVVVRVNDIEALDFVSE